MARLTPRFSAHRAVRQYTEQHYLRAAAAYRLRNADKGAIGRRIVDWQHSLEQKWASLHFGEVKVETRGNNHEFEVQTWLNDLDPETVRLELYADGVKGRVATSTAQLFPRPGPRRTTTRERYLTSKALPSHWKKDASSGRVDPLAGEFLHEPV